MKDNFSGNKGEWSEVYAIFKIIGDKQLYAGDINHKKINNVFFPVIGILKKESENRSIYFSINDELVFISEDDKEINRIPIHIFADKARFLLKEIKAGINSFRINEIESFLSSLRFTTIKHNKKGKADIYIKIHDFRINQTPMLGFSIKSEFGSLPTLFNASKSSNITYSIENYKFDENQVKEINTIEGNAKYKRRIKKIYSFGGKLKLHEIENFTFNNNLIIVDSLMPGILSELLINYYLSSKSNLKDLSKMLNEKNPLKFNFLNPVTQKIDYNLHPYYENNIKKLLVASAQALTSNEPYAGKSELSGGFIVVREDGEVICYHIYNKNEYENYLFSNAKIDTPSSGRHEFGKIFKKENKLFIKLNFQIRFCK